MSDPEAGDTERIHELQRRIERLSHDIGRLHQAWRDARANLDFSLGYLKESREKNWQNHIMWAQNQILEYQPAEERAAYDVGMAIAALRSANVELARLRGGVQAASKSVIIEAYVQGAAGDPADGHEGKRSTSQE